MYVRNGYDGDSETVNVIIIICVCVGDGDTLLLLRVLYNYYFFFSFFLLRIIPLFPLKILLSSTLWKQSRSSWNFETMYKMIIVRAFTIFGPLKLL